MQWFMTHWFVLSGAAEESVLFWVSTRLVVVLVGDRLTLSIGVEMVRVMRMAVRRLVRWRLRLIGYIFS